VPIEEVARWLYTKQFW